MSTSCDALRFTLEGLPKRSGNLPKMFLTDFPLHTEVIVSAPSHLVILYPEEIVNGSLDDEAAMDMDVCLSSVTPLLIMTSDTFCKF